MAAYKTVNIEQGFPTAEMAKNRLSGELRIAKAQGAKALKIIHGYGSSGTGGAIKRTCHSFLDEKKRAGFIKNYIKGEDFTSFNSATRTLVLQYPPLTKDIDYQRQNDGITVIIF